MLSAGFLWGCSPAPRPVKNDVIDKEVDAVTDVDRPMDLSHHQDPTDKIRDELVTHAETSEVSKEISFGDIIDYLDGLTEITKPAAPTPPMANLFSELPCGFPASIRIDDESQKVFVTCETTKGSLQERSLIGGVNSPWKSFEEFDGRPSNHVILSGGYHLITRSSPDGFVLINDVSRKISDEVIFSKEYIADKNGKPLAFLPNMPSGAALIKDNVCIVTSNMDHIDMDPLKSTHNEGTLICFSYDGFGAVVHDASTAYYTGGINPTAVAPMDSDKLAVLCSNGFNPNQKTQLSVDIFSFPSGDKISHTMASDDRRPLTGIISPEMPISQDGAILVGLQKPSNAVAGIDAQSGDRIFKLELGEVESFISSLQIFGNVAAASDFGLFGSTGKVIFFNTAEDGWDGTVETKLPANPGPATIFDGVLYQTATDASMGGAIYEVDLSGMN
ncbi:MAG TPA: hypothetical protein PKW68_00140 [bacterium]|nr:hypothetical protein [bacterium]